MSVLSSRIKALDPDAVRRAERKAPARLAELQRGRDRRNIRRALKRLGYHEQYVEKETARLSAMQAHHRRAALAKLRKRLGQYVPLAA